MKSIRISPTLLASALVAIASGLLSTGCSSGGTASRWMDPLGWTGQSQPNLSEQADFRKRVDSDPFPSASQVGIAPQPRTPQN